MLPKAEQPAIAFGVQRELPFPADRVWALLGDFARLPDWFPGVDRFRADGNRPGALRHIVIASLPEVVHRLEEQDDAGYRTVYRVISGPGLAADDGFVVEIRLTAVAAGACRVDWNARIARRPALVPAGGEAAFAQRTRAGYERALDFLAGRLAAGKT